MPESELDDKTKEELYDEAQELDIEGRSSMDKEELAEAVAAAESNGDDDSVESESNGDHTPAEDGDVNANKAGGFQPQTAADGTGQAQAGYTPDPGPEANDSSNIKTVAEEYEEQHERRKAREAEIEEAQATAKKNPW